MHYFLLDILLDTIMGYQAEPCYSHFASRSRQSIKRGTEKHSASEHNTVLRCIVRHVTARDGKAPVTRHGMVRHRLGPVYTYLDIFEPATFSFWIQLRFRSQASGEFSSKSGYIRYVWTGKF